VVRPGHHHRAATAGGCGGPAAWVGGAAARGRCLAGCGSGLCPSLLIFFRAVRLLFSSRLIGTGFAASFGPSL
jgi:hypothetical protein